MGRNKHKFLQIMFPASEHAGSEQPFLPMTASPYVSAVVPSSPGGKHPSSSRFPDGSSSSGDLGLHPGRENMVTISQSFTFLPKPRDTLCLQHSLAGFPSPSPPSCSSFAGTIKLSDACTVPWSTCRAVMLVVCPYGHVWTAESGFFSSKQSSPSPLTSCQKVTATGET